MSDKIATLDPVDEARAAFQYFDTEGRGKISARDLRAVATEIGEILDMDEAAAMIEEFDLNGDKESKKKSYID